MKIIDVESIRHIHTDTDNSFYLGIITASIREADIVFTGDDGQTHTICTSKRNMGLPNASDVIKGVYSLVHERILEVLPEGKILSIYEDVYDDIHNRYLGPHLKSYAIHFTKREVRVEYLTAYRNIPKIVLDKFE